ncbi:MULTISPECIES: DEAD/DEAH box helicase [Metallosphaera]|uniref:DEAD/DEAH box helicase domain protein n=3 Tax=Metallosphaera TaxID=41980 RepID=A4YGU9_METS5|nr:MULTISPECIES: DEAD/DEAH box helicase [Metallosphaera]ABP95651.1 DEAD/DEAH box helicase domain protein [Metallosphaera sedula DSM 5348]AIM27635.1 DEAD/DEAH box helicase domain protein [Metallosphaera sedula]AKV74492.1 RNA helicase [Metallosphaera sedula]AKV76731.1 RNA helicase [Metallosphaera sedula]AKV78982.1 RNA helicase [Metallosphaera sedula]
MFDQLSDQLKRALADINYQRPTKVQEIAIPVFMNGESVIVQAKTGSGKTASYLIPVLERYHNALILVPTRELAEQVAYEAKRLGKYKRTSIGVIIGGVGYDRQERESDSDIIVGTPGRILDLWGRGTLDLSRFKLAIVDEVDRMLDMGFIDDVRMILSKTSAENFGFFSATVPPEVKELAEEFSPNARFLKVDEYKPVEIDHEFYPVRDNWHEKVTKLLKDVNGKAIVFTNTKARAEALYDNISDRVSTSLLHGDMSQGSRRRNLMSFKRGDSDILISTDLAARGIDVIDVEQVVNFDLPRDVETYIHRVGRTGRMGRKGRAVSYYTRREEEMVQRIRSIIKSTIISQ